MTHPELIELTEKYGPHNIVTLAAEDYFAYHPTHSFCPTGDNGWWVDFNGSVWTPTTSKNPVAESELFYAHDSFYEVCWNGGDVEAVFRDGALVFDGVAEVDAIQHQICTVMGCDSFFDLAADLAACYRIGCNPLPTLRQRLKHLPLIVQFGIMYADGGYYAEARSATLVVRLDDKAGDVGLELIDYYADDKAWYDIQRHEDVKVKDIL